MQLLPSCRTTAFVWAMAECAAADVCVAGTASGEACLALPKLNLQFLTFHDYLLRNFNLFRLEATYEVPKYGFWGSEITSLAAVRGTWCHWLWLRYHCMPTARVANDGFTSFGVARHAAPCAERFMQIMALNALTAAPASLACSCKATCCQSGGRA